MLNRSVRSAWSGLTRSSQSISNYVEPRQEALQQKVTAKIAHRIPNIPLIWIASVVIFLSFFRVLDVPGIPFIIQISVVLAFASLGFLYFRGNPIKFGGLLWVFSIFVAIQILSVVWSSLSGPDIPVIENARFNLSRWRFSWQIGAWRLTFSIFVLMISTVRSERDFKIAGRVIVLAGIAAVAWMAWEILARIYDLPYLSASIDGWDRLPVSRLVIGDFQWPRAYGTATEPKELGRLMLLPFFVVLAFAFSSRNTKWFLLSIVFGLSLVATGSTTVYVGGVVGFGVWTFFTILGKTLVRWRLFLGAFFGGLAILLMLLTLAPSDIREEIGLQRTRLENYGTLDREKAIATNVSVEYGEGWELGWRLFRSSPVIGVGIGNSPLLSGVTDNVRTPFNLFLLILAETGILGLSAFFAFIFMPFWRLARFLGSADSFNASLESRALLVGLVSFFAGSLVMYNSSGAARLDSIDWVGFGLLTAGIALFVRRGNTGVVHG